MNLRFLDANLLRQVQHLAIRMETTWNYTKRTYRSCSFFFNSYTHMVETNTNPFKLKSSLLFWVPVQLSPNQAPFCGANPPVLTMVGKDQFASCSFAINLPRLLVADPSSQPPVTPKIGSPLQWDPKLSCKNCIFWHILNGESNDEEGQSLSKSAVHVESNLAMLSWVTQLQRFLNLSGALCNGI